MYETKTVYQRGVEDFLMGRPFPAVYDRWPDTAQLSYERGRLMQARKEAFKRKKGHVNTSIQDLTVKS